MAIEIVYNCYFCYCFSECYELLKLLMNRKCLWKEIIYSGNNEAGINGVIFGQVLIKAYEGYTFTFIMDFEMD